MVVWGGLVIGSRPADHNHPYGHGKAEPLAALAVAILLLVAAAGISIRALHRTVDPGEAPAAFTLLVLLAVVVVKEAMYRFESRVGQRIESTVIVVDAWHHRSDALTSAAAAIGITVALIGGEGYEGADGWAALAACAVIFVNAFRFARSAVVELMDTTPDTELGDSIQQATLEVDGARCVEKILLRKMGPHLYVDLHLEVDPGLTVRKAHAIAHDVKDSIMSRWPTVADVLVHVEPHGRQQ
jgi:cation diffusion facilitator family transporter